MLYLTPTVLILVLQTTLTTITALENFAAVPRDKYALLPRMDSSPLPEENVGVGFNKSIYVEVHPCAVPFFRSDLSSRYTSHSHTLHDCIRIESSAAWRSKESGCLPVWKRRSNLKDGKLKGIHASRDPSLGPDLGVGICFIFKPDINQPESRRLAAWEHPCQTHFSAPTSQWYTRWNHITYNECRNKENAEAWFFNECYMLSGGHGSHTVWSPGDKWLTPDDKVKNTPGQCFVLDKVPVSPRIPYYSAVPSYVEVHPCDIHFRQERSTLFSILTHKSFAECKEDIEAVAWISQSHPRSSEDECVPFSEPIKQLKQQSKQRSEQRPLLVDWLQARVRPKPGLCFKFNGKKSPDAQANLFNMIVPYKHVCDSGFTERESRWYSLLDVMSLEDCGKKDNVAAWRMHATGQGPCFVFYWHSNTQNLPQFGITMIGQCFIRDKVVPLGSSHPPPWIVTIEPQGHQLIA